MMYILYLEKLCKSLPFQHVNFILYDFTQAQKSTFTRDMFNLLMHGDSKIKNIPSMTAIKNKIQEDKWPIKQRLPKPSMSS